MEISRAALPPIQPNISATDRAHPRFGEYLNYRAAMSRQLVEADSFSSWLRQTIEAETPHDVVFKTGPQATMAHGWYKRKIGLNHKSLALYGPFDTKAEAEAS